MIRLIIDGQEADLLNDEFTWNMQCANFFSFDTRQFSCSDVMYLPMSTNNNEIFDYAGMVGSVSGRPQRAYEEVEVLVITSAFLLWFNLFPIISDNLYKFNQ